MRQSELVSAELIDRVADLPQDVIDLWLAGLEGLSHSMKDADAALQAQLSDLNATQRCLAQEVERLQQRVEQIGVRSVWDELVQLMQEVAVLRRQLLEAGIKPESVFNATKT